MHCNICQRPSSVRLPFNCASCARDALYQTRLLFAHTLLEQEAISSQIDEALEATQAGTVAKTTAVLPEGQHYLSSLHIKATDARSRALQDQVQLVDNRTAVLRNELSKISAEIARRKTSNIKRRNELTAARQKLVRREALEITPLVKHIARIRARWDTLNTRTAESRILLCKEAASLYGLQKQSPRDGISKIDSYTIGDLPMYDLRGLNSVNPVTVSSVNSVLAHLVHLLSHYLSLRLPAEITLPQRDHSHPTISLPASSYTGRGRPLSYGTLPVSSSASPSAPRAFMARRVSKPKPLYLRKQLSLLAKDEPHAYATAVEGIALLMWDIAWLCRTQGTSNIDESWEDVLNVGRRLWELVNAQHTVADKAKSPEDRRTKQDLHANVHQTAPVPLPEKQQSAATSLPASFGRRSHDTIHSSLTTAEGAEYMRKWRLQDPAKVIDRVKHMLLSERTGAGWEILEGKEWEMASAYPEHANQAMHVGASTVVVDSGTGGGESGDAIQDPMSGPSTQAAESSQDGTRGTSGWTKLKSR